MVDAQVLGTCAREGVRVRLPRRPLHGAMAQLAEAPDLKSGCSGFESQWLYLSLVGPCGIREGWVTRILGNDVLGSLDG